MGSIPAFCTLSLIFTSLSLAILILSYIKAPVLAIMPSFPPLWGYLLSKSGCESYALKIYLGILYLPFGIILSLIIKQYEPFLADRKSTRLNSSHVRISYAVFCLKK